tara:strand:- start:29369 stop:29518 length:150 start_codon:yes stop_codon:yes gene_type:complete
MGKLGYFCEKILRGSYLSISARNYEGAMQLIATPLCPLAHPLKLIGKSY